MEGESGVTRSIINELHSWDIQVYQMGGESMVLLQVSLMKFILWISNEMKWNVKVVLLEVSLMNFILEIFKELQWKRKVLLFEYH